MLLLLAGCVDGASVSGQVQLVGSGKSAVKRKGEFSGVAVWLTAADEPDARGVRRRAQMLQKDKKFSPHVLVIETGTTVDFPNEDPIFHNAFSNYNGQVFDVALYPPGSSRKVRFDRAGIVRVFCNIHSSMSAIIVVVNSSYFATTDERGDYTIANVKPGQYKLHFFHERATPETLEKLTKAIAVGSEPSNAGTAAISEAGYLPVAHKNKYGQEYPPGSEASGSYSLPLK